MDCRQARRALRQCFDGEIVEVDGAVKAHLAACSRCARAIRSDEAVREWFSGQPRPEAPRDLAGRVLDRIRSSGGRLLPLRPLLKAVAAAAALLFVATGVAAFCLVPETPANVAGVHPMTAHRPVFESRALELLMDHAVKTHAPGPRGETER